MNIDKITQPFIKKFPGDFSGNMMQRETPQILFTMVKPVGFENPKLIAFNEKLSKEIGLGNLDKDDINFLSATNLPKNINTYATAYAGHQFGNWVSQLGDGRAILAGEITNQFDKKSEIQWKGAGMTPYSRTADGRAVLRSSVREYLMSEAMHHLGIPTTRALSLCLTGEEVVRDIMYSGNPQEEKGAVIIRTSESFLRLGHFEFIRYQRDIDTLTKLTDFTIENYYSHIKSEGQQKYKDFYNEVCKRTMDLVMEWMRVGFVHGVLNTDNVSILGVTIDYGPFSMMDKYDLDFTPNTTDLPERRYSFKNQGQVSCWNLWQLGDALFPLIQDEDYILEIYNHHSDHFWEDYLTMIRKKLGFDKLDRKDDSIFAEWQNLMFKLNFDYTLFFNQLEKLEKDSNLKELFSPASYDDLDDDQLVKLRYFISDYRSRLEENVISKEESLELMRKNNPKFILRNYLLYECINEIDQGKTELFEKLTKALENPYEEVFPEFSVKRPSHYDDIPGCSMLSCSS